MNALPSPDERSARAVAVDLIDRHGLMTVLSAISARLPRGRIRHPPGLRTCRTTRAATSACTPPLPPRPPPGPRLPWQAAQRVIGSSTSGSITRTPGSPSFSRAADCSRIGKVR